MRRLVIVTVVAVLVAGCGAGDEPATTNPPTTSAGPTDTTVPFQTGELISLDIPRQTPSVTDADIAAVARGDAALGLDLLRVAAGDENVMISPYSIATALSRRVEGPS